MNKGLTGGFDIFVEEVAELVADKGRSLQSMVVDIVLYDSENNYADSTLVFKPTFYL